VDCAEATKKTVQAMRNEWWGFFGAGDCPAELPVMNFQAKPDHFLHVQLKRLFIGNEQLKVLNINEFLKGSNFLSFVLPSECITISTIQN
jgi:hypothetical protein